MDKTEFKVGDIVEAFGNRGKITEVTNAGTFPVYVVYDDQTIGVETFRADGRAEAHHKTPSLKLIERPRKTKKVKVWITTETVSGRPRVFHWFSKEFAQAHTTITNAVAQEIEVEVLDE